MSPKRAGIFDPWRQAQPPELEEPQKILRPLNHEDEDNPQNHCVQFAGVRAGVNVWLSREPENPSVEAREVLVDLVHRLYLIPEAAALFTGWHIHLGSKEAPSAISLIHGPKLVTIIVPEDAEGDFLVRRAVDALSLALRECIDVRSEARDIVTAMRVKPYVK